MATVGLVETKRMYRTKEELEEEANKFLDKDLHDLRVKSVGGGVKENVSVPRNFTGLF